jgi:TPR repeat protein
LVVAGQELVVRREAGGWRVSRTLSSDDAEAQCVAIYGHLLHEYEQRTVELAALTADHAGLCRQMTDDASPEQAALLVEQTLLVSACCSHRSRLAALDGGGVLVSPSVTTTTTTESVWVADGQTCDWTAWLHACGRPAVLSCLATAEAAVAADGGKRTEGEVLPRTPPTPVAASVVADDDGGGKRTEREVLPTTPVAASVVERTVVVGEPRQCDESQPWRLLVAQRRWGLSLERVQPAVAREYLLKVVAATSYEVDEPVSVALLRLTLPELPVGGLLAWAVAATDETVSSVEAAQVLAQFWRLRQQSLPERLWRHLTVRRRCPWVGDDGDDFLQGGFFGSELFDAALCGDALAQLQLSRHLQRSGSNHTLSRHWCLRSAAQSFLPALESLAAAAQAEGDVAAQRLWLSRLVVARRPTEPQAPALLWRQRLCELGVLCMTGRGGQRDHEEALRHWRQVLEYPFEWTSYTDTSNKTKGVVAMAACHLWDYYWATGDEVECLRVLTLALGLKLEVAIEPQNGGCLLPLLAGASGQHRLDFDDLTTAAALSRLAFMAHHRRGVQASMECVEILWHSVVRGDSGDSRARRHLGDIFWRRGDCLEARDSWRVAGGGDSQSLRLLGLARLCLGQSHDSDARRLLTRAAEAGDRVAQRVMGAWLRSEVDSSAATADTALRWLLLAAEAGDVEAQLYAGSHWAEQANPVLAFHWYERAAQGGDRVAQHLLVGCYQRGEGVAVDEALARFWSQVASRPQVRGLLGTDSDLRALPIW